MDIRATKNKWYVYAPDVMVGETNNRDLPESEQVTVEVHPLNNGESQHYQEMVKIKGRPGKRDGFKLNSAEVRRKMFIDNVKNLKNLTLEGKAMDVADLYDEGQPEIVNDIIGAIEDISKLEEGERKNLSA